MVTVMLIGVVNVLMVGAGGLSLWTLRIAEHEFGANIDRVRLTVADSSVSCTCLSSSSISCLHRKNRPTSTLLLIYYIIIHTGILVFRNS